MVGSTFLVRNVHSRGKTEFILMVKMETRHLVEGYFGSEFRAIRNYCGVMAAWSSKTSKFCEHFFGKTTPYGKISKILFRKFSKLHWSTFLYSNVVKFVGREIDEIVHYLVDQKKQNFGCLSNCRYCVDRAQNLPGPAPNNVLACFRFHPNRFTFGGVIAKCVNAVFCP